MRPVMQTTFATDKTAPDAAETWGNCLSACIASVLELPIEDVPIFVDADGWFNATEGWLRARGWGIVVCAHMEGWRPWVSEGLYGIAHGPSPRGDWLHSVVVDSETVIVHDPFPDGGGLAGDASELWFLVPLRPEAVAS